MLFQSLGQEEPLEEEMATHCSIHNWKIPWTKEPGGLQPKGLQRVRHGWAHTNTLEQVLCLSTLCCNCRPPQIFSQTSEVWSPVNLPDSAWLFLLFSMNPRIQVGEAVPISDPIVFLKVGILLTICVETRCQTHLNACILLPKATLPCLWSEGWTQTLLLWRGPPGLFM